MVCGLPLNYLPLVSVKLYRIILDLNEFHPSLTKYVFGKQTCWERRWGEAKAPPITCDRHAPLGRRGVALGHSS